MIYRLIYIMRFLTFFNSFCSATFIHASHQLTVSINLKLVLLYFCHVLTSQLTHC